MRKRIEEWIEGKEKGGIKMKTLKGKTQVIDRYLYIGSNLKLKNN